MPGVLLYGWHPFVRLTYFCMTSMLLYGRRPFCVAGSDPEKFGDRSVGKVRACGAHVHNRNTTLINSKSHRF